MAKCRNCGAEIPDGAELCDKCAGKINTAKNSESYLDSLLSAVMTEEPKRREVAFSKREAGSPVSMSEKRETSREEFQEEIQEEIQEELQGYSIFDDLDLDETLADRMLEEDLKELSLFEETAEPVKESTVTFVQEPEEGFEEPFAEPVPDIANIFEMLEETEAEQAAANDDLFTYIESEETDTDSEEEVSLAEALVPSEEGVEATEDFAEAFFGETPEAEAFEEVVEDVSEIEDIFDFLKDEKEEPVAEELFMEPEISQQELPAEEAAGEEEPLTEFGEFADLLSGFGDEELDLFNFGEEPQELDAVSGKAKEPAPEITIDEEEIPEELLSASDETGQTKKKKKKEKKKGGLFHKLFDNVKVDPSKIKPEPTKEEIEAKKRAAKEAKERSKEEKEALLAEKKAQENEIKAEKLRKKKEAKAEKKARKLEEAKLVLEEMEHTRINRAGASIVFIFFAMIAVVIIVGTSIFSYSLSIRNAQYEFDRDEYTLAYNEIFGLDVKDEDIVLYDRIMTVMYVQKQLNSYYNYYEMEEYPKALDSLLKGLQRYDKYISLAIDLEIESDLDLVRKSILDELAASFYMSEREAMGIIQADSQLKYSEMVYDVAEKLEAELKKLKEEEAKENETE